ncbi:MAG: SDR family oxidoreductase [Bacteroidota bacterium]
MDLNLIGKNALVCGSSQGIGFAAAQEIALLGANVILFARNEISLKEAMLKLDTSKGQQHNFLVADFNETEAVKNVVEQENEFHILVNNTGGPAGGLAIDADESEFLKAFSSHLVNNQNLVKAIVPFMKKEGYGRIINIVSSSVKAPIAGLGVSNTIRGAVNSWAKTLSSELGQFGITVNNVLPGSTETGRIYDLINNIATRQGKTPEEIEKNMRSQIPAGRFAETSEVGSAVAFLASPVAGYISGISLMVDGGRTNCL